MFDVLNKYGLIKGSRAYGVELIFNSKDDYVLYAVEIQKIKEELIVASRLEKTSFTEISEANKKKYPVYLSIDGKGIIHKKITVNEHSKDQELLHQILPNAAIKDFYMQRTSISETENWVSVIRKELLDEVVEQIETLGLFCVQVSLGPFVIERILPLLKTSELVTNSHHLKIQQDRITNLLIPESSNYQYNLGGENIEKQYIVAFANAFSHFISTSNFSIHHPKIKHLREEFYYKNKYTVIGFSMLVLFLVLTISNMLLYNSFQNTNNVLQFQLNSKQKYIGELNQLKEEVKLKEEFVQHSGLTQSSKMSYYADQIALGLPESIQLNELFINPLMKRIRKAEDINYQFNKISISGTVNKSIELNNWVKQLKNYDWISEVAIVSFLQDNLKISGDFEIEVSIKN